MSAEGGRRIWMRTAGRLGLLAHVINSGVYLVSNLLLFRPPQAPRRTSNPAETRSHPLDSRRTPPPAETGLDIVASRAAIEQRLSPGGM